MSQLLPIYRNSTRPSEMVMTQNGHEIGSATRNPEIISTTILNEFSGLSESLFPYLKSEDTIARSVIRTVAVTAGFKHVRL